MNSPEVRQQSLSLVEKGDSLRAVSKATGINRSMLLERRDRPDSARPSWASCPRCAAHPALPEPQSDYAYLLGLYLGDGCISVGGDRTKGVWRLRIMCGDAWPGLIEECVKAMHAVRPSNKILLQQKQGCTEVGSYSRHWPCLFPQHGPGRKHLRKIELADWQQFIVERYPGEFARGLMHSDGYRGINRVRAVLADGDHWYEYPRYLFVNESVDILALR